MFQPKGTATIEALNVRRGKSDDAVVAIDVKLKLEGVGTANCAAAIGADDAEVFAAAFFRPVSEDANRSAKFLNLKTIETDHAFENKHLVKIGKTCPLLAARVGKISIRPRGNLLSDVTFTVSIEEPPEGYVESLAQHLHVGTFVELEQDAELGLEAAGKAPPKTKAAPTQTQLEIRRTPSKSKPKDAAKKSATKKAGGRKR